MAKSSRYSFKDTLKENAGLSVFNTGYERCDSSYCWGPAVRDHYLIHYISSGKGVFTCNREEYALRTGDLFLIQPGQLVSYRADADDPWEYCWVGFNGADAKRLVSLTGFSSEMPIFHTADAEETGNCIRRIAMASDRGIAADAEMVGYLYLVLAHLMRLGGHPMTDDTHRDYLDNAIRFIQYNYAGNIGIVDIARYAGISRSQLYREFMRNFGTSPQQFLQTHRINQACGLLTNPALSVAEVAGSVGYNDPLYFSRVFRQIKGCSPSQYRQQHPRIGRP